MDEGAEGASFQLLGFRRRQRRQSCFFTPTALNSKAQRRAVRSMEAHPGYKWQAIHEPQRGSTISAEGATEHFPLSPFPLVAGGAGSGARGQS